MLSPGFHQNRALATKVEPLAKIMFIGLWGLADRNGCLKDDPDLIRALIFPYQPEINATNLLNQLEKEHFIVRYAIDGAHYIFIPNFRKYQHIHPHEAQSDIPLPPDDVIKCNDNVIKCNDNKINSRGKGNINIISSLSSLESKIDVVARILEDLNMRVRKFRPSARGFKATETVKKDIARWLKHGYTLEDFIHVHQVCIARWKDDPKQKDYLTPGTLYRLNNFERYREWELTDENQTHGPGTEQSSGRQVESYEETKALLRKLKKMDY